MTKKILISGAAGFLGFSTSKRLLEEGFKVLGIDNLNPYYSVRLKEARLKILSSYTEFLFEKVDLIDKMRIEALFLDFKPQCVIHYAAQAGVRYSLIDPYSYAQSNVSGSIPILESCRKGGIEHFILASSSSVYGMNRIIPFKVNHPADHPVSIYAATKKAAELIAHAYSHLFEIPISCLRFFTVYGPWGRPDMAYYKFTQSIYSEQPIEVYAEGKLKRDYTYVDDVVEAVIRLIDSPPKKGKEQLGDFTDPSISTAPFRIHNVGNRQPEDIITLVKLIENYLGKKAHIKFLPMPPGDVECTYADTTTLEKEIGYSPKTSLEEGIRRFVQWFCTEGYRF
ncbi:NAD-dependent epimerase/dehydratase family protein [Methylacidiphilum caldifontis]|uniref:UDP-glucuronate 5-epimerase n=1 Tax=Methylacidiphilum caldifontis TaxID=2795386 RepID=A0A4Y8PAK2_9BACT|nr:NAD-dependent epimerase/dehydratase family protein [Methylacidiphilum caldifontis]QSR89462.1 GDP-mannose 4,6-dehydratase [Methylacidiphilum caldifontis]TFE67936.1 UDP-glucuronate 5-epimerase [Methylacidiphilum caldifontis]